MSNESDKEPELPEGKADAVAESEQATSTSRDAASSAPDTERDSFAPTAGDSEPAVTKKDSEKANDSAEQESAPMRELEAESVELESLSPPSSLIPETAPSPGAQRAKPPDATFMIVSLMMVASLVMVLFNLQDSSLKNANTGSRYATVESLVDYGTFYIDKSQYRGTIDKVKVGDNFLSSKPPVLPTFAAGAYAVYQKVTGRTFKNEEGPVVWFMSLCTGWFFHLLFLIYFYRFCRLLLKRQLALIGAVAAACFSYLGVAYATAINNHSIGASLAIIGFYYVFRIRTGGEGKLRHWIAAGLVFGILPTVDLPSGAFLPFVAIYLWLYDWRRTLYVFLPLLLPGLILHLALGYATTGSVIPAYLNSELKNFEGNYFRGKQSGIDALREPKHIYTFNCMLGHHGLFSMTPLFCFSAWEVVRCFRKRVYFKESLLLLPPMLIIIGFYLIRTRNYGGWCVGMRHMVPVMPFLLLYFGLWLDRVRLTKTLWAVVLAAFGVGAFHVQDGLTSPFQFSMWHNFLEDAPNRGRVGKTINVPKKKKGSSKAKPRRKPDK